MILDMYGCHKKFVIIFNIYIELFKQRLIDYYIRKWNSDVHENEILLYY